MTSKEARPYSRRLEQASAAAECGTEVRYLGSTIVLAGGALGTGYALPTARTGPTTASILATMSPQTRQYTKAIMNLTFAPLAAGPAGHP